MIKNAPFKILKKAKALEMSYRKCPKTGCHGSNTRKTCTQGYFCVFSKLNVQEDAYVCPTISKNPDSLIILAEFLKNLETKHVRD